MIILRRLLVLSLVGSIFMLMLLASCRRSHNKPIVNHKPGSELFDTINVQEEVHVEPSCYVHLEYLHLTVGSEKLKKEVNTYFDQFWTEIMRTATDSVLPPGTTLEQGVKAFKEVFQKKKEANPDLANGYDFDAQTDLEAISDNYFTFGSGWYISNGNELPIGSFVYTVFDRSSGKRLTLTDVFTDTVSLRQIVNKKYRESQEGDVLETDTRLPFAISPNFGILRDSIVFYYDASTQATNDNDATELPISKSSLKKIINPAYFK